MHGGSQWPSWRRWCLRLMGSGMTLINATPHELRGIHMALVEGLENGTLRPVIGKTMKLGEAPQAHEAVLAPGSYGKIVMEP